MLLALAQWLQNDASFLRVFTYLTFRAVGATITALFVGLVCGPLVRTACPTFSDVSLRITHGPHTRPTNSAVMVAPTARNVR